LRPELAHSVLPPPLEQHVGVEPIAQRQFRDGRFRLAGFDGQSALELNRVIGPASPTSRNNFTGIQNGHRHFVWRTLLSLTVTLFARPPRNDAYIHPRGRASQKQKGQSSIGLFCFLLPVPPVQGPVVT
jgi:hypothetical protein